LRISTIVNGCPVQRSSGSSSPQQQLACAASKSTHCAKAQPAEGKGSCCLTCPLPPVGSLVGSLYGTTTFDDTFSHEAKTEDLLALESKQAKRVHRHQHGCAGIGENGRPEAGNADNRGDEEHRLEAESDGDILMDVAHSALR
jgi:hypothetical protein